MSRRTLMALLVLALVGLVMICMPRNTLPIFRLAPPAVTAASAVEAARALLQSTGPVSETSDRFILRSGPVRLEVYKTSGGVWAEDTTALWNPDLNPLLPDTAALRPTISRLLGREKTVVRPDARDTTYASFEFTGFGATYVTTLDRGTHTKTTVQLDRQINFAARVKTSSRRDAQAIPIAGGGGEFKVTFGDQGRVIGYSGVWREIVGVAKRERLIPRAVADREFLQHLHGLTPRSFDARLAYESAPAPLRQEYLRPVYIYSGTVLVGGESVPLQEVTLPATSDPTTEDPPAQRTESDPPRPGSTDAEVPDENASEPPGTPGGPWHEVGASWLGAAGGLSDAEGNVNGLLDKLLGDGWAVNFNRSDKDAWYQDWKDDRERWVDAADLVFYTGHASMNGWMLQDHEHATSAVPFMARDVTPEDVASSTGGMYGGQDLEWLVISACGPLQDEELSPGGGAALDRWAPAFGGLHLLLGFGSVKFSSEAEGARFAELALEGKTLINAWFRTAEENQPSTNHAQAPNGPTVWVGAMWAYKTGQSPYSDHLWGHGAVAKDSKEPTTYRILWSQT